MHEAPIARSSRLGPRLSLRRLARLINHTSISHTLFSNFAQLRQRHLRLILGRRVSLSIGRRGHLQIKDRLSVAVGQQAVARSRLEIHDHGTLIADGSVVVSNGCFIRVGRGASLKLGDGTFVNSGTRISSATLTTIGRNCLIGFDVIIMDDDYHHVAIDGQQEGPTRSPITIQDHVWIGARTIVLKGVTVGSGSVVAAGTVVTRDVPPNTLVGGSPMRILRENVSWRG